RQDGSTHRAPTDAREESAVAVVGGVSSRPHEMGLRLFDRRAEARRHPGAALAVHGAGRESVAAHCRSAANATIPQRLRSTDAWRRLVRAEDVAAAVTTRAAVSARTSRTPASFNTRAHASNVAPVVLTSSTSSTIEPISAAASFVAAKAPRTFR